MLRCVAIILLATLGLACSQAPKAPAQSASQAAGVVAVSHAAQVGSYTIGVDDQVKVSVWRNPDLSVEVPVRPDGFISVPLVGEVRAGGLTPREVAANIERELSQYIRQPKVSVILTQLVSHQFLTRVRVTGSVNKPVSIPYRQGMTVLDLVLEGGGITEFAKPDEARLYRKVQGKARAYRVRLGRIVNNGDLRTNYPLQPGDVLTIPERRF